MTARRRALASTLGLLALAAGLLPGTGQAASASASASASTSARPTVLETRVLGRTPRGRAIRAYRVGNPASRNKVVIMSTMHGDEPSTRMILNSIRDGAPVHGADIWLIPIVNPDGLARGTRKNAHGVDINRNFPYRWADLDGHTESGPRPASEPETRALMRFFQQVRTNRIVSFHQPLHGVDVSTGESRRFAVRLADGLGLPRKRLVCGGVCHGTFTQWYMHRYAGVAVTVEYGEHPTTQRMTVTAPRQLLGVVGAWR